MLHLKSTTINYHGVNWIVSLSFLSSQLLQSTLFALSGAVRCLDYTRQDSESRLFSLVYKCLMIILQELIHVSAQHACLNFDNMFSQVSLDHLHSQVALQNSMHLEVNQQLLLRIRLTHLDQQCHSLLNKPSQVLRHLAPHPSSRHRNLLLSPNHRPISLMLLGRQCQHPLEDLMPLALQRHQVSLDTFQDKSDFLYVERFCIVLFPTQVEIWEV